MIKKSKKIEYNNKNLKNNWLYDTSSSIHITNNKDNFIQFKEINNLQPILTGKDYIKPSKISTIQLPIIYNNNDKIQSIYLNNGLYIPEFLINIISSQKHYKSSGKIQDNKLLDKK